MAFKNYRKESSERSDEVNWAKKILIEKTGLFFDSIEGCNENKENIVTHLMERARVDLLDEKSDDEEVLRDIINLETQDILQRKINFAKAFNRPLTYVLYCNENQHVWVYTINEINACKCEAIFISYKEFSNWIAEIKGWKSSKSFRERKDLPIFDRELRATGCAWPTNIDCFVSNENFEPIGIIEFQNANKTAVEKHCNNEFFWGKYTGTNDWGKTIFFNDVRRWLSQEILRVQSGLRLYVITWSENSNDFILKEIDQVVLPQFPRENDWRLHGEIETNLHYLAMYYRVNKEYAFRYAKWIASKTISYNLMYTQNHMNMIYNNPPLNPSLKTFPKLYYKFKHLEKDSRESLPILFLELINKI